MLLAIPRIFFNDYFWLGVILFIGLIVRIFGEPQPPAEPNKFFLKHGKTIYRITDIFLISIVILISVLLLYGPICVIFDAFYGPQQNRGIPIRFELHLLFLSALIGTGYSSSLIGLLSVFHSNFSKAKRIFLFAISLLPAVFGILLLLVEFPENRNETIKIVLMYSVFPWIFNAPAIFMGKHFFFISWNILLKLRIVPGNSPDV